MSADNNFPTEPGGLALAGVLLGVALLERVFAEGGLMVHRGREVRMAVASSESCGNERCRALVRYDVTFE